MSEIKYGLPPQRPIQMPEGSAPVIEDGMMPMQQALTESDVQHAIQEFQRYKAGKAQLEKRVMANENWYMLRNWDNPELGTANAENKLKTRSAWLFNAINNAHTDAMSAYPTVNVLPREMGDMQEAERLTKILPVVLEQNDFKETYNRVQWKKEISGAGVYGTFWDPSKHNGLGDISIERVDLLSLYWEPGVNDIQDSRYVFCVKMIDRDTVREMYPELDDQTLNSQTVRVQDYDSEDKQAAESKVAVVDWYYHRYKGTKKILHLCKFVGNTILYASENMPQFQENGYYHHGEFPFDVDVMYPMENSPAGFSMIDVNKNTQEQIDLLNSAITENAIVSANLRYMVTKDSGINIEQLKDPTQRVIDIEGSIDERYVKEFKADAMPGIYVQILNNKVEELKQTSGNQDVANGVSAGGATAYSAIKTLIETAGKNMKGANYTAYRCYRRVLLKVIELIRQFYDVPRFFRITGEMGAQEFISYDNRNLLPQPLYAMGQQVGMRNPLFDLEVTAEQESEYSKMAQNEDAIRLQSLGVFNPQMADQSLMLLEMMDFRGKDELMRKVRDMGVQQKLLEYFEQVAMALAQKYEPETAEMLMQQIQRVQLEGAQGMPQKQAYPGAGNGQSTVMNAPDTAEKQRQTRASRLEKGVEDTTKPT